MQVMGKDRQGTHLKKNKLKQAQKRKNKAK